MTIQRILVEETCGGCFDGAVQTPETYEPSKTCERCKGTGLEQSAMTIAEFFEKVPLAALKKAVLGTEVPGIVMSHDITIRALEARCKLIDGFHVNTNLWSVPTSMNSASHAEEERLRRLRLTFGAP